MNNLKITAELVSPIVHTGYKEFPLDSLLANAVLGQRWENFETKDKRLTRSNIPEDLSLPLDEFTIGKESIYCSSFAIYNSESKEGKSFWAKHFPYEYSNLLNKREGDRKICATGGRFRSYMMPMMMIIANRIIWFVRGDKQEIRKLLFRITGIGKKCAYGYGYIAEWKIKEIDKDYSILYDAGDKYILMRNIPDLPKLDKPIENRKGYYAIKPPYWHPYWKRECYMPC